MQRTVIFDDKSTNQPGFWSCGGLTMLDSAPLEHGEHRFLVVPFKDRAAVLRGQAETRMVHRVDGRQFPLDDSRAVLIRSMHEPESGRPADDPRLAVLERAKLVEIPGALAP